MTPRSSNADAKPSRSCLEVALAEQISSRYPTRTKQQKLHRPVRHSALSNWCKTVLPKVAPEAEVKTVALIARDFLLRGSKSRNPPSQTFSSSVPSPLGSLLSF